MRMSNDHRRGRTGRRGVLRMAGLALAGVILTSVAPGMAEQTPGLTYMTPDVAHKAAQDGKIILIDIRRPEEWRQTGVAEGAIGLDMTDAAFVDDLVELRMANPATPLALICRTGNRTGYVTTELAKQGFPGLVDVQEGMVGGRYGPGWLDRGLPTYAGTADNVSARTETVLP